MKGDAWPKAPLRSRLVCIEGGRSPDLPDIPAGAGEWGVLKVSAVHAAGFRQGENKAIDNAGLIDERYEVKTGDLLISRANTPELVGSACIATESSSRLMLSDKTLRVLVNKDLADPRFVNICLSSHAARVQIENSSSGSSRSMQNISQSAIERLMLPWPPLGEQLRIVEALESIDERISVEVESLRKESWLWGGLVDLTLERHSNYFDSVRLVDVCRGASAYGSNAAAVSRNDHLPRYVRITDIDHQGNLSTDLSSAVSVPWESGGSYILAAGDLLIARTGFTTGKSYLYQESDGLCAYAGYLVRFRVDPDVMLPEYAFMWTRSNIFKKWVSQNVREVGQRNISAREYDGHRIAVPPLLVQRELVAAWAAARAASLLRQQEISRLRTLKQAIAEDLLAGVPTGA